MTNQDQRSNRGFASMDEDQQRSIASQGGRAAHEKGTAHEWNSEEAREAGHKGGNAPHGSAQGNGRNQSQQNQQNEAQLAASGRQQRR